MSVLIPLALAASLTAGQASAINTTTTSSFSIKDSISSATLKSNTEESNEIYIPDYQEGYSDSQQNIDDNQVDGYDFCNGLSFEDRNSNYKNAIQLYPTLQQNVENPNFHSKITYANLHSPKEIERYETDLDKDYYYFCLYSDSTVSLTIDSKSTNYVTNLHKVTYEIDQNDSYIKHPKATLAANPTASKTNTNYDITLTAGTYYLSIQKQHIDNNDPVVYSVDLIVKGNDYSNTTNLLDLRYNKKLKAAIWKSDFTPAEIECLDYTNNDYSHLLNMESSFIYFDAGKDRIPDYLLNSLSYQSLMEDSCIYVWDSDIANGLYSCFTTLSEQYDELYKQADAKMNDYLEEVAKLERDQATWKFAFDIVVNIATVFLPKTIVFTLGNYTKTLISAISKLISYTANNIFSYRKSKLENPEDVKVYLRSCYNYCKNIMNQLDSRRKSQSPDYVLRIPLTSYLVENNYSDHDGKKTITFGTKALTEDYYKVESMEYDSIAIETNSKNGFFGGKLYGISENGKISNDYSDVIPNATLITPRVENNKITFSTSNQFSFSTNKGDFKWFCFIAPYTGNFSFILSNNNTKETTPCFEVYLRPTTASSKIEPIHEAKSVKEGKQCYYDCPLEKNDMLYFKTHGQEVTDVNTDFKYFNRLSNATFYINDESDTRKEYLSGHTCALHYESLNDNYHQQSCWRLPQCKTIVSSHQMLLFSERYDTKTKTTIRTYKCRQCSYKNIVKYIKYRNVPVISTK